MVCRDQHVGSSLAEVARFIQLNAVLLYRVGLVRQFLHEGLGLLEVYLQFEGVEVLTAEFRAADAAPACPLELGGLFLPDEQNRVAVSLLKVEAGRVLEELQASHVDVKVGCLHLDQLVDRVLLRRVVLEHVQVYELDALELVLHATETEELEHLALQEH